MSRIYPPLYTYPLTWLRKRSFPSDSFLPPDVSVQLWSPLLTHIRSLHPDFSTVLINKIVAYLVSDKETVDADGNFTLSDRPDPSFDMCLARWAMWLADAGNAEDSDESDRDSQRVTMMSVITALGPGINQSGQTKKPYDPPSRFATIEVPDLVIFQAFGFVGSPVRR